MTPPAKSNKEQAAAHGLLIALVLAGCVALAPGCSLPAGRADGEGAAIVAPQPAGPFLFSPCGLPGIKLSAPTMASGGYVIDVRCLVTEPEKAAPLLRPETRPYLIVEKTGQRLYVPTTPKVGSLRQTTQEPVQGRAYFMLFGNPGRLVKPGDAVTLVIGDQRAEGLVAR